MPKHACYVGHYCATFVWVDRDHVSDLSAFTLIILDIATLSPAALAALHPNPPSDESKLKALEDKVLSMGKIVNDAKSAGVADGKLKELMDAYEGRVNDLGEMEQKNREKGGEVYNWSMPAGAQQPEEVRPPLQYRENYFAPFSIQ